MIRINVIGTGFIDMEIGGLSFTTQNQWFRFADISLGRSVEFSIPDTPSNRSKLGYGDDPAQYGEMLRRSLESQMIYDGGSVIGTLNVTGYQGGLFRCAFFMENAPWINEIQGKKLSDCVTSFIKGVSWTQLSPPVHADEADPQEGVQILQYDNGVAVEPSNWQLLPSVNVFSYINDILTNMGVPHALSIPKELWMVAASLKGGTSDAVMLASTATDAATVTQTQGYISVVHEDLEWASANVFGSLVGGGSQQAAMFKAERDIKISFPQGMPPFTWVIRWNSRLKSCETIAGGSNGILSGMTVDIPKGTVFFFADNQIFNLTYYGWKDTAQPFSFAVTVERNDDLQYGEVWQLRCNHPDMTVFEFLRSVALATGLELTVTADGVSMGAASYGKDFRMMDEVISIDEVTRRVEAWGDNTSKAVVTFDSEEYVTEPIRATFAIDNEQIMDTKEEKSAFSEGAVGDNGVLIKDVDNSSGTAKLTAKKWTLAMAVTGETFLQRIDQPAPVGYDDIAQNSTCIKAKLMAGEAAFFTLRPGTTWLWRGIAYLWTDAQWSEGVLTLTLQKVSQYPTAVVSD